MTGVQTCALPIWFTAQTELELEKALTAMGITDLFDVSRADLRAIGSAPSGNNLYVSFYPDLVNDLSHDAESGFSEY